jgi:hypothetical protein
MHRNALRKIYIQITFKVMTETSKIKQEDLKV